MFKVILYILGGLSVAFGTRSIVLAPSGAAAAFSAGYYVGAGFWVVVGVILVVIGGRLKS